MKLSITSLPAILRLWASALGCALVLLLLVHQGDRQPYSLGGEEAVLKRLYLLRQQIDYRPPSLPSDWVLVNVGYDRELTPVSDLYGMPLGVIDITHRGHLVRLLQVLEGGGNRVSGDGCAYRGILLDVSFNDGLFSPYDSLLFELIERMPRLLVAQGDEPPHPLLCTAKCAPALYRTSMDEGNFVKYPYYDHGQPTLATRYYTDVMQGSEPLNWRDMHCMTLPLTYRIEEPYDNEGNKTYYNLGADLLDGCSPEEIRDLCRGKHIIIGDFTNLDLHDTYVGVQSGSLVLLNAITTLQKGQQRVSWWSLLVSLLLYTLACAWIIRGTLYRTMPAVGRMRRYLLFAVAAAGYNLILFLLIGVNWYLFDQLHDACFPELFLTALFLLCQYRSKLQPIKNLITSLCKKLRLAQESGKEVTQNKSK